MNWGTRTRFLMVEVMLLSLIVMSQEQLRTLVVTGHDGSVRLTPVNGKDYVEIEALAHLVNGSLSFSANQTTLTLSPSDGNTAAVAQSSTSGASSRFSKEFLRAGIEEMSTIREWHSALESAIENQYPITEGGLAHYQVQALTNLRIAQTAVTTDADKSAVSLISNEYQKMKQLSDKYVTKRTGMNYIAPDSLKNDQLNQSIIACGKSLGAMAATGQFVDDGTCQ